MSHRVGMGGCVFHSVDIYISINNLHFFLNPARRPQSRKGRLSADALRQRRNGVNPAPQSGQRGGVKEDYYV